MPPSPSRAPVALLLAALALRSVALWMHPVGSAIFADMDNYRDIADRILAGVWEPGHFLPAVGFSLVVALSKRLFTDWTAALGLYHLALSVATVWLVWSCATRAFGRALGMLSLALAAVHVPWIVLTTFALSETTFTFLMAALAWASLDVVDRPTIRAAAVWGLLFVVSFWVKGTAAFLGPLFLVGVLARERWSRRALVTVAAPLCAVIGAGLLVHGVLTRETIGTFRISASAGGLNFVEGKCPSKRNEDSAGMVWASPLYDQLGLTARKRWDRPFTDSGYFMKEGARCIAEQPLVLLQSLENIPFLFVGNFMWPSSQSSIAPYARLYELVTGPFLMAGVALWLMAKWPWRRDTWGELLVWGAPLAALAVCVYVFKSEIRFRVPFDVWIIPVAMAGWTSRLQTRRLRPAVEQSGHHARA
jgi:hypothetical protein